MSEQTHQKYMVQKGDTLESIAEKFNLSIPQIRKFHNLKCDLNQLLGQKLEIQNKFIFIPVGVEKEEKSSNKIKNALPVLKNKDGSLSIRPKLERKVYQYTLNFKNDNFESRMDFTMDVSIIDTAEGNLIYEIYRRKPVYINREPVSGKMDLLSTLTSDMLYPMQLVVNKKGEVQGFHNYNEIKNRLPKTVANIYNEFARGPVVDEHVKMLSENIEDEEYILENTKRDLFIKNFFSGLYQIPANEESLSNWVAPYPIVLEEEVDFDFEQRVVPVTSMENYVHLERYGKVIPYDDDIDLDGVPQKSGELNSHYFLHPLTNQLEIARVNYKFNQEKYVEVSLQIKNIEGLDVPPKEMNYEIIKEEL